MRTLRNSLSAIFFLATLVLADTPATAPDSAVPEMPRKVIRVRQVEEISPYRRAILTHYSDYVGFGAGLTNGIGLSYRHWFSDAWGVQLNLLPYYSETKYPSSNANDYPVRDSGFYHNGFFSAGLTALHEFARLDAMRFLGYVAGSVTEQYTNTHYYYQEYEYSNYSSGYVTKVSQHEDWSNLVSGGFGLGMELYVWRFSFSPMLGFRGAYDLQTKEKEVGPTVEGAAHFRF